MSQATLTTGLLNFNPDNAGTTDPTASRPSFFVVRSSLLTLLATGAIVIAGAAGISRISDSVVESNARTAAATAAIPPAEYYQFIATMKSTDADGMNDTTAAEAPVDASVDTKTSANAGL